MSTPYQRGHAFELRVKKELEAEGYLVCRSPASKSPFDLLAVIWQMDQTSVSLVQCKLHGVITKAEENELCDVAEAFGCRPLLAYQLPKGKLVHYKCLHTQASWSP